jgi:thiosulfate/3-mercaptopyruvate sulfurtransferase
MASGRGRRGGPVPASERRMQRSSAPTGAGSSGPHTRLGLSSPQPGFLDLPRLGVMSPSGPLVEMEWLSRHMEDPELVVADVRWYPDGSGRARFEQGHIPGSVFVDIDSDLASPKTAESGRHPLPIPEAFAQAMEKVGIGDEETVVAYDDAGGSNAARLWWMLAITGHPAAVLDGGLQAWKGPLERGPSKSRSGGGHFTPVPWPPERIADVVTVDRLRQDPSAVLLDARAAERYRGEVEPIDPVPGHIPGAGNAPWNENVDPRTGRFRSPEELRERFRALGVKDDTEVITYCGSGVTSCHNLLALKLAGIRRAKLYVGSWSEWITDPSRPVALGSDKG